ncbi:hypothetical protein K435DRAFT_843965 [Dendrothele bispora CBS 962.96]|uniref:Uncharacterized protein n=1 Tax=Dendrothele bispora (strain CBS 962.96) TaxID=1314807 RepID=A0A4S8L4Y5_DENBC|nr:hypothetical protein K435DRAFT_843965 [Dendrothele bispora CBS 962.96]
MEGPADAEKEEPATGAETEGPATGVEEEEESIKPGKVQELNTGVREAPKMEWPATGVETERPATGVEMEGSAETEWLACAVMEGPTGAEMEGLAGAEPEGPSEMEVGLACVDVGRPGTELATRGLSTEARPAVSGLFAFEIIYATYKNSWNGRKAVDSSPGPYLFTAFRAERSSEPGVNRQYVYGRPRTSARRQEAGEGPFHLRALRKLCVEAINGSTTSVFDLDKRYNMIDGASGCCFPGLRSLANVMTLYKTGFEKARLHIILKFELDG